MKKVAFLGIDVGSISTNIVVIDSDYKILKSIYARAEGKPIASVQAAMGYLSELLLKGYHIADSFVCTYSSLENDGF